MSRFREVSPAVRAVHAERVAGARSAVRSCGLCGGRVRSGGFCASCRFGALCGALC